MSRTEPEVVDPKAGQADGQELIAAVSMQMPFGRFAGTRLIDLPEPYLVWFHREGFPNGQLGQRLALVHEIKVNGLEKLVRPLLKPREESGSSQS